MLKRRSLYVVLLLGVSGVLMAQEPAAIQQYIADYKELAIEEMVRTGVPASITLAQGVHETFAGESDLVKKSNNHFGIKCKSSWSGESVRHDDDERAECFRKYDNAEDSYRDHSNFLKNSPRYAALFTIDPTDYSSWAWGLKKAGYATNPKYPQLLIKLVEDYNLNDYTLIAMGKKTDNPTDVAINTPRTKSSVYSSPADTEENNDGGAGSRLKAQVKDYPEGLFKINETKVVFARKGESWLAIADEYKIPFARLFEFNDVQEQDIVAEDQLVYLQRKRRTGNNEFHIVQPGETVRDIAQTEAIRLENLLGLNMLNNGQQPAIGEKLFLQSKAQSMPRLTLRSDYNLYDSRSAVKQQ